MNNRSSAAARSENVDSVCAEVSTPTALDDKCSISRGMGELHVRTGLLLPSAAFLVLLSLLPLEETAFASRTVGGGRNMIAASREGLAEVFNCSVVCSITM